MSITYRDIIKLKYPNKQPISYLNDTYDGIVWNELDPTPNPTRQELDAWIAALSIDQSQIITKYQFRKLFTLQERIAIDNFQTNPNLSQQVKDTLTTIMTDLTVSGNVELFNPDVISGVRFLYQVGLLTVGRADQILANTPPSQ